MTSAGWPMIWNCFGLDASQTGSFERIGNWTKSLNVRRLPDLGAGKEDCYVRHIAVHWVQGMSMPTTTNSEERLEARISTEQKRLFKQAATLRGVTLTDFVVNSVHEAAVRTLEARHVIELSQKDQRAFVDALSRPPAPTSVLRKAWARHSASRTRSRKRRLAKRAP
jgi:uncharacterized protein (DUF1778 family)